jgi:hypothetical protein
MQSTRIADPSQEGDDYRGIARHYGWSDVAHRHLAAAISVQIRRRG